MRKYCLIILLSMGAIGYSQSAKNQKRGNKVITFPNGDESITIVANGTSNSVTLKRNQSYESFDLLELSNREMPYRKIDPAKDSLTTIISSTEAVAIREEKEEIKGNTDQPSKDEA